MAYATARSDFEYLEKAEELSDWVSLMDDLRDFMEEPTKAFGTKLYERAIELWFREGDREGREYSPRMRSIRERYYA